MREKVHLIDSFIGLPDHFLELVEAIAFFAVGFGGQPLFFELDFVLLGRELGCVRFGKEVMLFVL